MNVSGYQEGLLATRFRDFEGHTTEIIFLEFTISRKIWLIIFAYRPLSNNNKDVFFSELLSCLNRAALGYDNFLVISDLVIDTLNK